MAVILFSVRYHLNKQEMKCPCNPFSFIVPGFPVRAPFCSLASAIH